ncbi:hemicentin-1-like [Trachinotus anak]|uniref:hemicentin-1-like n=1 Tax=Trachinotus anak TaxID=443729 RepID=UPI0039F19A27
MLILIWATLLFSVRGNRADAGSFPGGKKHCQMTHYCITLSGSDIKAEAGLCAVIPCSFTAAAGFDVKTVIWYKCDPPCVKCGLSDTPIFDSSYNGNVQSAFRGRVSLLEPDLKQQNCSIIINDLKESDSGSYQLTLVGFQSGSESSFIFKEKATIAVTGLSQKPTVMTPPLAEGQQATLTCTAPGLCSGSDPKITWMWRGAGEKDSHITGHITDFKTENLIAITQRHSSTLTLNASAEHHGTQVTCEVSFTGKLTTEKTVTLSVTYVKDMKISGTTTLERGDVLNLTCSVDSFPASLIKWTKNGSNKNLQEHRGSAPLIIHKMTADDFGQYICTAKHLNNTLMKNVTLYLKKPVITGMATVKMGDALNLTCSAGSFRPLDIIWTKLGSNKNLTRETKTILQNDTGTATLLISNVTAEDSGQYVCTAKHVITALTTRSEVTVKFFPRILSSSACEVQSELLTCVCVSEGSPLPTIKWPLLENYIVHLVSTTMTDHTVNNTIILTVKDPSNTVVQCVSSNENGESKENLSIPTNDLKQHAAHRGLSAVPFLITAVLSLIVNVAFIIGFVFLWNLRKKVKPDTVHSAELIVGRRDEENKTGRVCPEERDTFCLKHQIRMFVLIWATLFFFMRHSDADTGASVGGKQLCSTWPYGYCITLPEGEITAEAGLCVVIPCSFTTVYDFTPQNLVWYKCEPAKHRCSDSDMIFHTNKNNMKVQSEFRGRVSLLEPDVSQNNCSIIINDLKESDSGSYQLRVNGDRYGRQDGFTYPLRATVSIKGLSQKPTVMTPPLTEGQQATLTCTAPGFCSGSDPKITWMWRGAGEKDSHITGNITDFKTENLAGFLHRHSSTLTFNASAEHHGTQVTCEVSFTGITTTEETVTLNVTYVKEVRITGDTRVKEGETLNLTCSVESFPPSLIMWKKIPDINIQNGSETNLQNDTLNELQNNTLTELQNNTLNELQNDTFTDLQNNTLTELQNNTLNELQNDTFTDLQNDTFTDLQNDTLTELQNNTLTELQNNTLNELQNDTETFLQERSGMATLSITNVTVEDSGLYICIVKHLNNTWKKNVDVKVIYMRQPGITGDTTVQKGDVLNLTCSGESFPPSLITWTKLGFNTNLHNGTDLQSNTGSATLMVPNVTAGDSGQYICTVKHLDMAVTIYADVTVTWFSKILQNSACEVQLEVLTCVCISEGFPLPTIRWPLLKNHTEYSVITSVSNHRVNSTIILTVKHRNTVVECVSSNGNEEAKRNLSIITSDKQEAAHRGLSAVPFLITAVLSLIVNVAFIICFVFLWNSRKKVKPDTEDRTYMSLRKTDKSPEYDVIGQTVNRQV